MESRELILNRRLYALSQARAGKAHFPMLEWLEKQVVPLVQERDKELGNSLVDLATRQVREQMSGMEPYAPAVADLFGWLKDKVVPAIREGGGSMDWKSMATQFAKGEEYYRGLLDQCARHLGNDAFLCDDGTVSEEPLRAKIPELVAKLAKQAAIPMLLWCPECGHRHIDEEAFAEKDHHTHACQSCGHCWRPAIVPTRGVRFLPGFKDESCRRG